MKVQHVLVMIHGMTPIQGYYSHKTDYDNLWYKLTHAD